MIRVGVIGCGHWGNNYLRLLNELQNSRLIEACDENNERYRQLKSSHPFLKISRDFQKLISNNKIDAVIVATPTSTHYNIARAALLNNKHVLVEKPLALKVSEGQELVELAKKKNKILMVAHTFLYNPGIQKLKKYVRERDFGSIYYIQARRTHLGLIRKDVNAVWDLAPHDISIFSFILDAFPLSVSAVGGKFLCRSREDAGFITLSYPGGIKANLHVSWVDANKVREVVVVGGKRRIVFDDLNNMEKIKIFEKGAIINDKVDSFGEFQILLRDGDIISPKIEAKEPLKEQCRHFLECIEKRKVPLTDGASGVEVIKIMVAIDESIKKNGMPVEVKI